MIDWSRYPEQAVQRLAIGGIERFLQMPNRPGPVELPEYEWHWVPLSSEPARVKLRKPALLRTRKGHASYRRLSPIKIHIHKAYSLVAPQWEGSGGFFDARIHMAQRFIVRIGWDDVYGQAVLFFADGGTLPPQTVHSTIQVVS